MATFIICYDLQAPKKDYSRITEGIEKLSNNRHKPLESTWIVTHQGPVQAVLDHLKNYVDANDKLLVIETGVSFACLNIDPPPQLTVNKVRAVLEQHKKANP